MQLSTIRRKKQKLIQNCNSWVALKGNIRQEYKALCAKEREALIKNPILPNREVMNNGNSTMDTR